MLLIPAIDLKEGHCVRLKQGVEFELRFRKWEGRWYISKVATVQALRAR